MHQKGMYYRDMHARGKSQQPRRLPGPTQSEKLRASAIGALSDKRRVLVSERDLVANEKMLDQYLLRLNAQTNPGRW